MPFKACEKHGGQLYPEDGVCPLCKAGVQTPGKETTTKQQASSGNKTTRTF